MVLLTLAFVHFYWTALTGWLKPPTDEKMVPRLEPIILVIIGYRLPAKQNEKALKNEIGRQTQNADAAQHEGAGSANERGGGGEVQNDSAAFDLRCTGNVMASACAENLHQASGPIKEDGLR